MEPDKIFFKLSEPLEYSIAGDFKETSSLEFLPPGPAELRNSNKLSQLVTNAVLDARKLLPDGEVPEEIEGEEPKEQENPTAKEIKTILMASANVDFNKICDAFVPIALSSGTYDGSKKLEKDVLKKIGNEDSNRMVCEYIANFIFPSLF